MKIVEEIKKGFAYLKNGQCLPINIQGYDGYVIVNKYFAVAIDYNWDEEFLEKFNRAFIKTEIIYIGNKEKKILILGTESKEEREAFSYLCADFLDLGIDNTKRNEILKNPLIWWNDWCSLVGNSFVEKNVYSIISEMIAYDYLYDRYRNVKWTALSSNTHDFISDEGIFEVKSTIDKYKTQLTVSSQFQINEEKNINIMFFRMEKSPDGVSIKDMIQKLSNKVKDKKEIYKINKISEKFGTSKLEEKYKVIERRLYKVNDKFPIIKHSYLSEDLWKSIVKLSYTIDLSGIEYKKF
ncbi:PD-(D/E)XK motif protein [Clostridium isatidis]|uniref:PD-(D/E)XK motif protein n=1 Tax=Clostridium isatidis TaxID=182773 RepID=UPI003AB04081